jgi:hypothetical protein
MMRCSSCSAGHSAGDLELRGCGLHRAPSTKSANFSTGSISRDLDSRARHRPCGRYRQPEDGGIAGVNFTLPVTDDEAPRHPGMSPMPWERRWWLRGAAEDEYQRGWRQRRCFHLHHRGREHGAEGGTGLRRAYAPSVASAASASAPSESSGRQDPRRRQASVGRAGCAAALGASHRRR